MPILVAKNSTVWRHRTLSAFFFAFSMTCVVSGLKSATAQTGAPFRLFAALTLIGGPDFTTFGFDRLTIADSHVLGFEVPNSGQVQRALRLPRSNQHLVIDIENWPLEGPDQPSSIAKYQKTLGAFRRADPGVKIGLYGVLPIRDHWRAIGHEGAVGLNDWKQKNTEIASSLVPYVDELFPSLYTFYGDKDAWIAYARANIQEARRIARGKPIYCFLWPQFHKTLAFLPGEFWYTQLSTCRKLADGIVIWGTMRGGPSDGPADWNEKAEWWQATLKFLREEGRLP
ncbi:hyaluronidase [Mesorhizobium sp. C420B]|uniref:hypothetical protein n=1 Tax=unclassified Mesorhizobium TaxID=325217 RepID=UPI0004CF084A|nr:hypothetical protein [Mesorhizobium sp. LSHC420B00]